MMQCAGFFSPSDRVNVTPARSLPFRTPTDTPTGRRDGDSSADARSILGLHQKLDFILSENMEQSKTMKKLQEENETLSKEVQRLKENVEHTQSVAATHQPPREVGRVPPAISVSNFRYVNLLFCPVQQLFTHGSYMFHIGYCQAVAQQFCN